MHSSKAHMSPDETPGSPHFLSPAERWWRSRQPELEARGYMLRPRYRPGWQPSWLANGIYRGGAEDSIMKIGGIYNMDATRMSDGASVNIKALRPFSNGRERAEELHIALFFSSEPQRSDPRNHCVPIIDWWHVPEEKTSFIVMPLLRPYDSPEFLTVGEAVDFFGQLMEGLDFMHENYVAHRDCCSGNIMMDPTNMYPRSFHPIKIEMRKDLSGPAPHTTRTDCSPKYYLIDFGLSMRFCPHDGPWPPAAVKTRGQDRTAPELNHSRDELYDPFPTDVYYIGNVIKIGFLQRYRNLDFMDSLIEKMTAIDPCSRPTIHEALVEFKTICRSISSKQLTQRLVHRNESPVAGFWRRGAHLLRSARRASNALPKLPSQP